MAEKQKRLLGVDLGDARTGLAVSDPLGMLANGIGYIKSGHPPKIAEQVLAAAKEYDVSTIVIGNPINMNGTIGPRADKIQAFVELMETMTDIPIVKFDERLTTAAAHRILNETNIKSQKRKTVIDTLSAQIILQNYMDAHRLS
ncbi:MAG: Holliday junction resolvase RuvX [Clostridia bacterium]|nr:Holliday junction resolvase RuvX [Clostridia bacterium]